MLPGSRQLLVVPMATRVWALCDPVLDPARKRAENLMFAFTLGHGGEVHDTAFIAYGQLPSA